MISAAEICDFKGSSIQKACTFIFLFFAFLSNVLGQDPATQVPSYDWVDDINLPDVTVAALNSDDINIAVATGPNNYVYILTFGNGVQKRNSDGSIIKSNFITGLDSPLDIAVDEEGYIYIADFQAGGNTYEDNGQIKVYDQNGNYQYSVLTSYFRPMGIDVDSENLYIAEYNDGNQGPESTPSSRIRIVDKKTGVAKAINENITIPYRIGVSKKTNRIYVSQAGNSSSSVEIYDQNLNSLGKLPGIESPGSVVVDEFGFIHVIEYTNRVNFEDFIRLSTNFDFGELLDLSHDIRDGVEENAFFIKIFNSSEVLKDDITERIDFPIDLALNQCDKLYVDNAKIFGTHTDISFPRIHTFFPSKIEFDLEIYKRTPVFDDEPPIIISCPDNKTYDIAEGETTATITYAEPIVSDKNKYTLERTEGPASGAELTADTYNITYVATDVCGYESECSFQIVVNGPDEEPTLEITCVGTKEIQLVDDQPVTVLAEELVSSDTSGLSFSPASFEFDCSDLGTQNITINATDDETGATDSCVVAITIKDVSKPEISKCPDDRTISLKEGETYDVPNFKPETTYADNCDTDLTYTQSPEANEEIDESTLVTITITDDAGLKTTCSFDIIVEKVEEFSIQCVENYTVELGYNINTVEVPTAELIVGDTSGIEFDIETQQFTCNDIGEKTIVINATKTSTDETASCTLIVKVDDTGRPLIVCPAEVQQREIPADGAFVLPQVVSLSGIQDNCAADEDLEIVQDPPVGTEYTEEGTYAVTITATDPYNNTETCEVVYQLTKTSEPSFECPSAEDFEPIVLDENCDYQTPDYSNSIRNPQNFEDLRIEDSYSRNDNILAVTLEVYDGETFIGDCTFNVPLIDETAPVITKCVDPNPEVMIAEGETWTLQDFKNEIEAEDNCDNQLEISQQPEAGTQINETTEVTISVTDDAGKVATCTFTVEVTIVEEGELALSCPGEYKILADENCQYTVPDFSDIVGVTPEEASITQSLEANSFFDPNSDPYITVTATFEDQTTYCEIYLLPQDQENPVARCIANYQISLSDGETRSLDPGQLDSGSTDNCGDIEFSLSKTEFTSEDEGENTVIFTVTDAAGNNSTCEVVVEVSVDNDSVNEAPVAFDEEYTTDVNTTLNVSAANGVLVNDTDPENDELTAILDTDVEFGSLQLNADGSFTYTPDTGFVGQDFFTYVANDGEFDSNTIFVSINVVDNTGDFGCNSQAVLSPGSQGETSLDIALLYHGNSEGLEISADQLVFTCEDIGENMVSLTYTGRVEGTCQVSVMVIDEEPPVLNLKDISINLNTEGMATIRYEDIDNGSYDNCGNVTYTLNKSNFSCKNVGENIIQVTAEDENGNIAAGTVTVTITDEFDTCEAPPTEGSEYIFIYPNPNTGSFKVATPADVTIQRLEVFDHRGRFIAAKDYDANVSEYAIELGPLQEAVYVVKIITNKETLNKRFIFKY